MRLCGRGQEEEDSGGNVSCVRKKSSEPNKFTLPSAETSSFTVCGIFFFIKSHSY